MTINTKCKSEKLEKVYVVSNNKGRILGVCSTIRIADNYREYLIKNGLEYDEWLEICPYNVRYGN